MTGSAPISFNAGAESGDRASANTSCRFALRRRTSGRPIAPLAQAIRIFLALPCSARFAATRGFFHLLSFREQVAREHDAAHTPTPSISALREMVSQVFVVSVDNEVGEKFCRRDRACIPADAMDGTRRLVPTFARAVDQLRFLIHL